MTEIVFLGTGTPNPEPDHQGPSLAIIVDGQPYLVDCGPGVVRQASAARALGVSSLTMEGLSHVFITHLHSDHTLGLPDLILTPAVTGRLKPLQVWGPAGTQRMVDHILEAWAADISIRLAGDEPSIPEAYEVRVSEFEEGPIFAEDSLQVKAFRVTHGHMPNTFGFKFETPDKVVVVSGDTRFDENLVRSAAGCDVLIHEAYSAKGLEKREPGWRHYHSTYHTSGLELGRLANLVQPKLLLLYHMLPFGESREQILDEVRSVYHGDVRIAEDLMRI